MRKVNIIMQKFRRSAAAGMLALSIVCVFLISNIAVSAQEPTLTDLYNKTGTYISSPTNHELTKSTGGDVPAGAIIVIINNETYYYTPTLTEDKTFLNILSAYGNNAIKTTTDASKAVYTYGGVHYTYDTDKLLKSTYTLTPQTSSSAKTITRYELNTSTGEYEPKYYEVSLNPANISKGNITYSTTSGGTTGSVTVNLGEGNQQELSYTYTTPPDWESITSVKTENMANKPDGYISAASGGALDNDAGTSVDIENKVYKECASIANFSYTGSDPSTNYIYGGAIYNKGILDITADFIGNYVKVEQGGTISSRANCYLYGGAIANFGTIDNISGSFIQNCVLSDSKYYTGGGAIYNVKQSVGTTKIGSIAGDFIGNYAVSGTQHAKGGAIYNSSKSTGSRAEIGSITGDFIDNYAVAATGSEACGGAIYNFADGSSSSIGDITGDFLGNYVSSNSSAYGGAIYNGVSYQNSSSEIGDITGDFIGNYATAISYAYGGAIYNRAEYRSTSLKIGSITGIFSNNSISSTTNAYGGAIYNYGVDGNASIGNIVGDFISNRTNVNVPPAGDTENRIAYGGAIYNAKQERGHGSAVLGYISGMFSENGAYVKSNYSADARGGAIYNTAQIGDENGSIINSSFINNYAVAVKGDKAGSEASAYGGAIYTTKDLTIVADDYTSEFSGNYVQTGTDPKTPEAIYVDSSNAKLKFKAQNNGKFLIQDQINGTDGYSLEFVGDNTGVADVNNSIKGAPALTVDRVTLNYDTSENNAYDSTSFKSVKVLNNATFNYLMDLNIENKQSDSIIASENSSGIISISKVNLIPLTDAPNYESAIIQVLFTENNNLQLDLTDPVVIAGVPIYHVDSEEVDDVVEAITDWSRIYKHHSYTNMDFIATLSLAKTNTTNDSLEVTITKQGHDDSYSLGDTLNLVNKSNLPERTFKTDNPEAKYDLTEDLDAAAEGTLNIQGAKANDKISTLNLNNKTGFNLTNETRLNIKDVKLTGNQTLVTVSNDNASVGVDGAIIDGNITTTNENGYTLDITGDSKFNGTVGKANAAFTDGTLKMNTNTFAEANLTANSGTIDLSNNSAENYNIGTLASSDEVTYIVDFDVMNKSADTITTTNASSGPVIIDGINFVGGKTFADLPEDMRGDMPYVVRILFTQNDDLYLELSDTAKAIIGDNEYIIGQDTIDVSDVVQAETPWVESFYNNYKQDVTQYGDIKIMSSGADDGTTNDSIGISYSKTEYGEKTYVGSQGDTLKVVNQAVLDEEDNVRTFKTTDSAAEYKVTDDLGETSEGTMNVVGAVKVVPADPDDPTSYEMTQRSTLDYDGHSGFVLSNDNTTLNFKDVKLTGATNIATSDNESSVINFDNVEIVDNDFGVQTAGNVNISGNSSIGSPIELTNENGMIDIDATDNVSVDSELKGVGGSKLRIKNGTVDLKENSKITSLDTTLQDTTVNVSNESVMDGNNLIVQNGASINMSNGAIGTMNFADMLLNGDLNVTADVHLSKQKMDMLLADTFNPDSTGMINVKKLNLLSVTKAKSVRIPFTNQTLANHVKYTGEGKIVYSPVYKYTTAYNDQDGYFTFTRSSSGHDTDFNPSILASQVSALTGIYGTQLQTFDYGFQHSSIYMDMPVQKRLAEKNENKYAFDSISAAGMYSPLMTKNDKAGYWVKPYAVFEKVDLKRGPKVSNMNYGVMFGFDTSLQRIRGGFDRVFTYYIGYSGSFQGYNHVDVFQNGGLIGFTTSLYKGNFFNATTVSVGASLGDSSSKFGSDTFTSIYGGVANKTGYNFEFKDGRFIIQPSFVIGYTFIDTLKYKTSKGVHVKSDPFNIIHIAPGLKFIANTKNGWQPYIGMQLVWDIIVSSKVTADGIRLPSMDFEPYFQYGLGVQRLFADRFMFFGQAMVRNGGRNGVAVSAGMRWILGE